MAKLLPEVSAYLRREKRLGKKTVLPSATAIPPPLLAIAQELVGISGTWNPVEMCTVDAETLQYQKETFLEAFLEQKDYTPQFTYKFAESLDLRESKKRLQALLLAVRKFTPKTREEKLPKYALYFKLKDDLATCDLVEGIQGKSEAMIDAVLRHKYPGVDPLLLEIAEEDFQSRINGTKPPRRENGRLTKEQKHALDTRKIDTEGIKEAFEWALEQYGILRTEEGGVGFRVVIDENATALDVRDKSSIGPAVVIPSTREMSATQLLSLIAHEIEGHARQSVNGERLFLVGGGSLKVDDETLYEGLAMRYEERFLEQYYGRDDGEPLPAFHTFAVHDAESGLSFTEVFENQVERRLRLAFKIPEQEDITGDVRIEDADSSLFERAWWSTYRVMRGHTDTRNLQGYAFAKDLAYLRGWLLDKQLTEQGHGHLNEASIRTLGALPLLAEFEFTEEHLPLPFKDVTTTYLKKLLAESQA
jgi:hypothetical protein